MLRIQISNHRVLPSKWLRAVGLGALVACTVLMGTEAARAQRGRSDNVDRLRDALDVDKNSNLERLKADDPLLAYRRDNLTKRAKALTTLGEMSKALLLTTWRLNDPDAVGVIDLDVFNDLAGRFQETAKNAMKTGSPAERVAVANLIGDMAIAERSAGFPMVNLRSKLVELAPALVEVTKEPGTASVRAAAAMSLANLQAKPDDTVKALGDMFSSRDPNVRLAATDALSNYIQVATQRSKKTAVRASVAEGDLNKYLLDASDLATPVACKAMGMEQPLEIRRTGADALKQITASLRDRIQDASRKSDTLAPPPSDRPWTEKDYKRAEEIRNSPEGLNIPQALDTLLRLKKAFENQDSILIKGATDPDYKLRMLTLQSLEELADAYRKYKILEEKIPVPPGEPPVVAKELPFQNLLRATLPALKRALSDSSAEARRSAVNILEWMGQDARLLLPDLTKAIQDKDPFVRWSAARTVGGIASRAPAKSPLSDGELSDIVQGLIKLLEATDVDLRTKALTAIERIGPSAVAAVPAMWNAVNQGDADYRVAVLQALQSIGLASFNATGAERAFARVLSDSHPNVRKNAAEAFGKFAGGLSPEDTGSNVKRMFSNPSSEVRIALERLLSDTDTDVRKAASEALLQVPGK